MSTRDNLTSLKGIEYFTNLSILSCAGNKLISLDVSSGVLTGAVVLKKKKY